MSEKITSGTKIKTLRTLRNIRQDRLAQHAGVSQGRMSLIEAGQVPLEPATQARIEQLFNLKLDTPEVNIAFLILASDAATTQQVTRALAALDTIPIGEEVPTP